MGALLDVEAAVAELRKPPRPLPSLTFREVECGYLAGRSLAFSVILHQLALLAILLSGRLAFIHTAPLMTNSRLEIARSDSVIYLPTFGGGSEGAGRSGGGSGQPGEATSSLPARSRRGFAYRGPQPMVSDPPKATLGIQTIMPACRCGACRSTPRRCTRSSAASAGAGGGAAG